MTDRYLLGDDDPELRRLGAQHLVWSEATHEGWREAPIRRGDRVLDVGCGPGFTTLELADWVGPEGRVVGLDPSRRFIDHLAATASGRGLTHLETRIGTIDALVDEDPFDVIHVRWVLCFLPELDRAIAMLARALAPGGRLVTLDYASYGSFAVFPRIPDMAPVVAAVEASWRNTGGDLDVQGKTPRACVDAGLRVTAIRTVSGLARPGEARWHWPQTFLEGYLPRLVADGLLDEDTVARFWVAWRERATSAGAYLFLPPLIRVQAER